MGDNKPTSVFVDNLSKLSELDNFQKYILGTKKNGQPRAIYDVVKDYTKPKKKKKKKKHDDSLNSYALYITHGKKKKKKKKKKDYWHI